jgi:hypothetical protein
MRDRHAWAYAPRARAAAMRLLRAPQCGDFTPPPAPITGVLGWVASTWRPSEQELMATAGLDATMYVKCFALGVQMFAAMAVIGLLVLVPLNATSDNPLDSPDVEVTTTKVGPNGVLVNVTRAELAYQRGFDALSLSNIPTASPRLWAHVVAAYAFMCVALLLLRRTYQQYSVLRFHHCRAAAAHKVSLTVLVNNVPTAYRSARAFHAFFATLYPSTFHSAWLGQEVAALTAALARRDALVAALEHAYGVLVKNETAAAAAAAAGKPVPKTLAGEHGVRPTHKVDKTLRLCGGTVVDSIDRYEQKLATANRRITRLQRQHARGAAAAAAAVDDDDDDVKATLELLGDPDDDTDSDGDDDAGCCGSGAKTTTTAADAKTPLPGAPLQAGFVTFTDTYTSTTCAHLDHGELPFGFTTEPSPEPRDIYWPNLALSFVSRRVRESLVSLATVGLVLWWIVPVSAVAAMSTLSALSARAPFLDFVNDLSPSWRGLLEGLLPTLALIVFNAVLPLLLRFMSVVQGVQSHSALEDGQDS